MTDPSPAGQHTLRRHNSALVLRTVLDTPGISRAAIAAHTGLAKATVSSLVDRLIAADLVAETGLVVRAGRAGAAPGSRCRPPARMGSAWRSAWTTWPPAWST